MLTAAVFAVKAVAAASPAAFFPGDRDPAAVWTRAGDLFTIHSSKE